MTNLEAAQRIREHNRIHKHKELHNSPLITEALEKAASLLERTPDMRPLIYDQVAQYYYMDGLHAQSRPVFWQEKHSIGHWVFAEQFEKVYDDRDKNYHTYCAYRDTYGKTWRCWPDQPTPEDDAAWPWEEGL